VIFTAKRAMIVSRRGHCARGDEDEETSIGTKGLKKGIIELISLVSPESLYDFFTQYSFPVLGAFSEVVDIPSRILFGNAISNWAEYRLSRLFTFSEEKLQKLEDEYLYGKESTLTKEVIDAVPIARNVSRDFLIEYEEFRNFLNVDRRFRNKKGLSE
jgi:hypothetical protein